MDKPWKVVSAFIGVFIAGAVFGAFFSLGVGKRVLREEESVAAAARQSQQPRSLLELPPSWRAPQLLGRLTERLDLTPEQKEHIKPLVQRATEDFRRQQQNNFRETALILQRLQEDIKKELTPEQQLKLERMEQRQRDALKTLKEQRVFPSGGGRFGQGRDGLRKGPPETSGENKVSPSPESNSSAAPRQQEPAAPPEGEKK